MNKRHDSDVTSLYLMAPPRCHPGFPRMMLAPAFPPGDAVNTVPVETSCVSSARFPINVTLSGKQRRAVASDLVAVRVSFETGMPPAVAQISAASWERGLQLGPPGATAGG